MAQVTPNFTPTPARDQEPFLTACTGLSTPGSTPLPPAPRNQAAGPFGERPSPHLQPAAIHSWLFFFLLDGNNRLSSHRGLVPIGFAFKVCFVGGNGLCSCIEGSVHISCFRASLPLRMSILLTLSAQNGTQYLQQTLTRAFHGSIISLFLVEALCLTHHGIPFAFFKVAVQSWSIGLLTLLSTIPYS